MALEKYRNFTQKECVKECVPFHQHNEKEWKQCSAMVYKTFRLDLKGILTVLKTKPNCYTLVSRHKKFWQQILRGYLVQSAASLGQSELKP